MIMFQGEDRGKGNAEVQGQEMIEIQCCSPQFFLLWNGLWRSWDRALAAWLVH